MKAGFTVDAAQNDVRRDHISFGNLINNLEMVFTEYGIPAANPLQMFVAVLRVKVVSYKIGR